jgi:hemerythrin-like domain-containing protein
MKHLTERVSVQCSSRTGDPQAERGRWHARPQREIIGERDVTVPQANPERRSKTLTSPGSYTTDTNDMRAVHAALRSSICGVGTLVAGAGSDPEKVAIVASFCENVLEFLHVHHEGEDELIYPVLEARCPQHAELLVRIDAQHTLLVEPLAAARGAVTAWQKDPSSGKAEAVVNAFSAVDDKLVPHLAEEELEVLPIASAFIAPEEWGELPGHALRTFGCDKPWLALGLVREALTEEQRAEMLVNMPPPVRDLWANEWEPAFTAFIGEVRCISGSS